MNEVQRSVLPAIFFASILMIIFTSMVTGPLKVVQAAGEAPVSESAGQQVAAADQPVEEPAQTGCPLSGAYPEAIQQWCDLIQAYAGQAGLEPNLVAAVMLQESGGNAQAYSKSGAVGLLQVMPRDGLAAEFMCPNGPCFSSRPSMEELYDPDFNISYGTRMLAGLITKTGDLREALKAYGPKDVGYYYADIVLNIYEKYR